MLLTSFRVEKNKKLGGKFQSFYFADIDSKINLFGPLMIKHRDFFYSRMMGSEEALAKFDELNNAGINEEDITLKQINDTRFVLNIRGDYSGILKTNQIKDVLKIPDTEFLRLVTRPLSEEYHGFEKELALQKMANNLLRDVHDNNKDNTNQIEKIKVDLEGMVKEHDSENRVIIDRSRMLVLLNSSTGLKRSKKYQLDKETIDNILNNGGLVLTDIEVAKYETPKPEIYLDTLVWKQDGEFKSFISGLPIAAEFFDSDIGQIPYHSTNDQHEIRKVIARYRRNKEFLFICGHNSIGYDERMCLQPERDKHKGRLIKGDGVFLITPDNQETRYHTDSRGREIFEAPGLWYIDTNLICDKYFSELFTDSSLETMMSFFGHFSPDFNYKFEKGFTYQEINEIWKEWTAGDTEKGLDLVKYCFDDTKFPYYLNEKLLGPVINIARIIGTDPFRAGYLPDSTLAKIFWDRNHFEKTFTLRYSPIKKDDRYKQEEDFEDLLSSTNLYEEYDIKKQKKKLVEFVKKDLEYTEGIETDCDVFYCPAISKGLEFILGENEEIKELCELAANSEPLIALMYSKVIEKLATMPLVDAKSVKLQDLHGFAFEKRYGVDYDTFTNNFYRNLRNLLSLIEPEDVVSLTGDFIYLRNSDNRKLNELKKKGYIHFGRCDLLRLKKGQIMNFNGLISSTGIKIPSKRFMNKIDPGDKRDYYVENHMIYEFINSVFESEEIALQSLIKNCNKLANNEFPAMWYVKKESLTKDAEEYANQESASIRIMKHFGRSRKGQDLRHAVGTYKELYKNFIKFDMNEKEEFERKFFPKTDFYQAQIFRKNGKLDRLVRAIFVDNKKKEELWKKMQSGEFDEFEDLDYLYRELTSSRQVQLDNGQIPLFPV